MIGRAKSMMRSTLVRYMISYTAIVLALTFGVGVYMNNSYAATIRKSIVESNINKLGRIREQNEQYLAAMLNIANQISLSPYIKPFKFSEEPERAYHLKRQLIPYALTNNFIDQLLLIFDEDDYMYSSATSMPLSLVLSDLARFERTTPEELLSLLRGGGGALAILPCQGIQSPLLDGSNKRMITVIVPLGIGERQRTGSVLFMIKESTYHQLFADEIYEPRDTFIFYGEQTLVSGKGIGLKDQEVLAAVLDNRDTLVKDVFFGGKGYLLVAQKAQKHDMQYVTLIPLSGVRQVTLQAQLGSMAFLLGMSIPCMLLVFYLSRRHAKPIRQLRGLFGPATPLEDDFEAIHSGIEALVDRNEHLHMRLDESLPALRSTFILHLVKGRYRTRQDAVSVAAELNMDIDKRYYIAALVDVSREQEEGESFRIEDMIPPGGGVVGYGAELVLREQFLFILFSDDAEALAAWVSRWYTPERIVLASGAHEDFSRVGGAYLEVSAAYDSRIVQADVGAARFQGMRERSAVQDAASPVERDKAGQTPVIQDILTYMGEHFADPNLSMSAIADVYSISAVRLSLDFKEAVGMSPSEYLLRLRLDKAQQLLRETSLSIKDVCAAVGYYDVSSFIRRFKRYAGVTPAQYRISVAGQDGIQNSVSEEHTDGN